LKVGLQGFLIRSSESASTTDRLSGFSWATDRPVVAKQMAITSPGRNRRILDKGGVKRRLGVFECQFH